MNIVMLGDGFTAAPASINAYHHAVNEFVRNLLDAPPFSAMQDAISVHLVTVFSNEEGIDVPPSPCGNYDWAHPDPAKPNNEGRNPYARTPRWRDTALGTSWCANYPNGPSRLITGDETLVWNAAWTAGVEPDLVVVLVNDWMYGASGFSQHPLGTGSGGIAYASINKNLTGEVSPLDGHLLQSEEANAFPAIAVHEFGHLGPFMLLDERGDYASSTTSIPQAVRNRINAAGNLDLVTNADFSNLKWQHLLTRGSSLPTACPDPYAPSPRLPDAGAAPGGLGWLQGVAPGNTTATMTVYHARCDCRMNSHRDTSFCVVCRETVLRRLAERWDIARRNSPVNARVIVDSIRLKQQPNSFYYLVLTAHPINSLPVSARWPSVQNQPLTVGQTFEPGVAVLDLPPVNPVYVEYRLVRANASTMDAGTTIKQGIISLKLQTAAAIESVDLPELSFTIGVVVR